jgi:thymidine kinase
MSVTPLIIEPKKSLLSICCSSASVMSEVLTGKDVDEAKAIINDYCKMMELYGNDLPQWLFCDESQFLTKEQVEQLAYIVDKLNINVMCYGLRSDFKGNLFEGSQRLFELADSIEELKLLCSCGRKAIMNSRIDEFGNVMLDGEQIQVGDNQYKSICRKCFFEKTREI